VAKQDQEQKEKLEAAIGKMFEEYVGKLEKDMKAATREDVDQKLRRQGTSLASLKVEFRYRLLAAEYVRRAALPDSDIDWQRLLAYYQSHRGSYAVPEKVSWQLLEIEFDNPPSRQAINREEEAADDADPWGRAAKSIYAGNVHSVADRLGIDLGSFAPESDKRETPQSDTKSATWCTDSDKAGTDFNKKHPEFDVVKYAAESRPHVDRKKARTGMDEALARLRKGESFDAVVKKFSNGPNANRGGWQSRISPDSSANKETAAALRQLPEGETSDVIETGHSFRIVRVACRTPAGLKPFEEVEESIRQVIQRELQRKALEEVYSRTSIESPYITDVASLLQPPPPISSPTTQDDPFAP